MSRSALGRSDSRAMSSSVGRVVGGGGASTPRTERVRLAERPRDERPGGARARRAGGRPRLRLFERRHVPRLHRDLGQDEPAPEVPLCAAEHGERRRHVLRDGHGARERHEELDAHRDAVALLDHRCELREERAVGLAPRDARELGAERQVRLAAGRDLGEDRREIRLSRKTCRAQRGGAAGLVSRERLSQQRPRLAILSFCERAQPARVQLALPRAPSDQHSRGLSERCPERWAQRGHGAHGSCELGLCGRPSLQRGVDLGLQADPRASCRAARCAPDVRGAQAEGRAPRKNRRALRLSQAARWWRERPMPSVPIDGLPLPFGAASPSPRALPRPRAGRPCVGPYQTRSSRQRPNRG